MTLITLKSCQQAALDALRAFARSAQLKGTTLAFDEAAGRPCSADPFGAAPCICLRIPSGGGETLMAAHELADRLINQVFKEKDGIALAGQLDKLLA